MKKHKSFKLRPDVRLPAQLSRCGAALMDQQMWCWGYDVRRPEGNLLLAYGAQKRPSPDPRYHSAYSFCLREGAVLNLWGWGVWVAHETQGSLFLSRARFRARYTPETHLLPAAWCEHDLPHSGATQDSEKEAAYRLLRTIFCWISDYEDWLSTQVSPDYRKQVIASWPQKKRYRGRRTDRDIAATWKSFAELLHEEIYHGDQT